jgi:TetR/AcrR family transcriptional repressor of lmrAB and yxaGH operons
MANSREQMVETACTLVERQGYHATGLNQILEESGAPKGSLYYHFPAGKEALFAEAIALLGQRVAARIRANLAGDERPALLVRRFVRRIASAVEASAYESGGPLLTIALETATSSERLNVACRAAYDELRAAFAGAFAAGAEPERAAELATFVVAAIEGGVVLSRTDHSGEPLRRVADELGRYLEAVL